MIHKIGVVLQFQIPEQTPEKAILNIASWFCFVEGSARLGDLSREWALFPDMQAVGVVDETGQVEGIILKENLLKILGKPYGWDALSHRPVKNICEPVISFYYRDSIFYVADQMKDEIKNGSQKYFLITTDDRRFAAVFSVKDILVYLSGITRSDMKLAKQIQQNIIEEFNFQESENLEILCVNQMALDIGGDIHYLHQYFDANWILILSDVCGKGIAAALVTSVLRGMAEVFDFNRGFESFIEIAGGFLNRMNEFATAVLLDINEVTREISVADMGHSYVYQYNDGLSPLPGAVKNPPLGIAPPSDRKTKFYTLKNPFFLAIMTDGIIEQEDSEGLEYPLSRFENIMAHRQYGNLTDIGRAFLEDIHTFRGKEPQHDDISFVLIRFKKPSI